jgi:hypothetical protein
MSEIFDFVTKNPTMQGYALLIPLFIYFLNQSSNDKKEQRKFTKEVMDQAFIREDRLEKFIDCTLTENTKAIQVNTYKIDKLGEKVNLNTVAVSGLSDRVVVMEKRLGV